jgi:hypothetical protein
MYSTLVLTRDDEEFKILKNNTTFREWGVEFIIDGDRISIPWGFIKKVYTYSRPRGIDKVD